MIAEGSAMNYMTEWMNFSIRMNDQLNLILEDMITFDNRFIMSENTELLNEDGEDKSFIDKVKDFFKSIGAKLKEIWNRFINMMDQLFRSDSGWLKKYKQQIMKADLREFKYTMFPYWKGVSVLAQTNIPAFSPTDKNLMKALGDEEVFKHTYFKAVYPAKASAENFQEYMKIQFRGGEEGGIDLDGGQLHGIIPGVITYCEQYLNIKNQLQKDINNIQKSVAAGLREANQAVLQHTKERGTAKAAKPPKPAAGAKPAKPAKAATPPPPPAQTANESAILYETTLTAAARKELSDEDFGLPENRSYPIHDAGHVKSAISRFHFCPEKDRKTLATNIAKATAKHKVKIGPDSMVAHYLQEGLFLFGEKGEQSPKEINAANAASRPATSEHIGNVDAAKEPKDTGAADATAGGLRTAKQADARVKAINTYVRVCQQVLSAKMEIYEERYKMYIKLLRDIVSEALGQSKEQTKDGLNAASAGNEEKGKVQTVQEKIAELEEKLKQYNDGTWIQRLIGKYKGPRAVAEKKKLMKQKANLEAQIQALKNPA